MRQLKELNLRRPKYSTINLSRDIEEYERYYSLVLPKSYIDFLKYCNGGRTPRGYMQISEASSIKEFTVNDFYGLSSKSLEDSCNLWEVTKIWQPIIGTKTIPFGADGGGNVFLLTPTRVVGYL